MSWRTIATVLIVVFAVAIVQATLAGPLSAVLGSLNDTGDYSELDGVDGYDGNSIIESLWSDWMNMGLIAMFGIMTWGVARVVRRELTRGRL